MTKNLINIAVPEFVSITPASALRDMYTMFLRQQGLRPGDDPIFRWSDSEWDKNDLHGDWLEDDGHPRNSHLELTRSATKEECEFQLAYETLQKYFKEDE